MYGLSQGDKGTKKTTHNPNLGYRQSIYYTRTQEDVKGDVKGDVKEDVKKEDVNRGRNSLAKPNTDVIFTM